MNPRLLHHYHQELRYLRELGDEFAQAFPKVASRLGMERLEVADPYVERLLEGCAFLAARVQLKMDAEFPQLSQRLLEMVYPGLTAPQPSMLVARVDPVPDTHLLAGHVLPRDSVLLAPPTAAGATRCDFRTTQATVLTPVRTARAEWIADLSGLGLPGLRLPTSSAPARALRLQLRLPEDMAFRQLGVDRLRFYLAGPAEVTMPLHEQWLSACVAVLADGRWLPHATVRPVGYAEEEGMLPQVPRLLSGLRVLQETLAFAERFLFVEVEGLRGAFDAAVGSGLELVFLLSAGGRDLEGAVTAAHVQTNCVPAINLFPKRADRIALNQREHEFHVVPDRAAPLDYEVYDIVSVTGHDAGGERRFSGLYGARHPGSDGMAEGGYYSLRREPRLTSDTVRREGARSGYVGSEVFVGLVDRQDHALPPGAGQLSVLTRCTNRDLTQLLASGAAASGADAYSLSAGVPLQSIRVVAGPSRPLPAAGEGGAAWRLLNLLSLNYLSLLDTRGGEAAAALRELLGTLPQADVGSVRRQIDALQEVRAAAVTRRHPSRGGLAFARGIQVRLRVDELGHAGGSAYLFGAALHQYLAQHVGLNSFVETVLESLTRGEVARWAPAPGARPLL